LALGLKHIDTPAAGACKDRRLFVFNGGGSITTARALRRILQLSGY